MTGFFKIITFLYTFRKILLQKYIGPIQSILLLGKYQQVYSETDKAISTLLLIKNIHIYSIW